MSKKLLVAGVLMSLVAVMLVAGAAVPAAAQSMSLCQTVDALIVAGVIAPDKVAAAKAAAGCGVTAPAAAYTFTRDLTVGSTGADVTALQTKLGVSPATGYFGSITKAAVVAYQTANGITPASGYVGPLTRASLNYVAPVVVVPPVVTPGTPSTDLEGDAGDVTVTEISTDVENVVIEGNTENVVGFKVEATDSDVDVTNLKVSLVNSGGGSTRLSRFADEVLVYMDGEEVGSADVADFTKSGTTYSKSISLDEAIVREGSNKKATFYVKVVAADPIDSTDIATDSWTVTVSNIRFVDGSGASLTASMTNPAATFSFSDLSTSGDVTLTISKGTASPAAGSVTVSDTGSTDDVLMLEFKMKAKGSDLSFDTLDVVIATSAGTVGTVADIIGEATLNQGSELASVSTFEADGSDTITFELDDAFVIEDGDTETFKVYVKVNDVDNFTSGDGLTVSFSNVAAEDVNGDVVVETGTAAGTIQNFVVDVPVATLVGTPTLAVYTHTDGVTAGLEDLYKATIKFDVTAPDSNAVYLPLDSFAFGTAGTSGVEYTASAGTITSAALAYTGTTSNLEQNNSVMVSAGETEEFTLTVYLTGDDAQGRVTITSIWYEVTDATPNGTPEITTGLTNFKTPLTLLAK